MVKDILFYNTEFRNIVLWKDGYFYANLDLPSRQKLYSKGLTLNKDIVVLAHKELVSW